LYIGWSLKKVIKVHGTSVKIIEFGVL